MDIAAMKELITSVGFPIVCVIGLGWFIYKIYTDTTRENNENMEALQARCAAREEKLFEEIKETRAVNAQAVATIAQYAERLDIIQKDVSEIKSIISK